MIFVLKMLFTLFMIVRTKIIGHYSLLVAHYLAGCISPPRPPEFNRNTATLAGYVLLEVQLYPKPAAGAFQK